MVLRLEIKYKNKILNTLKLDTNILDINEIPVTTASGFTFIRYKVEVTEEMKEFCWNFSTRIILDGNQFNRLNPDWTNNKELQNLIKIQRTYVGKIGELCFLILLASKNIKTEYADMFEIFEGEENTDSYDFTTRYGQTIDIKTAFRPSHRNLVVNLKQLNRIPKDFYVGVKLDATDLDDDNKIIDDTSITKATIYGYSEYDYINSLPTANLGEDICKAKKLGGLLSIDRLIKLI